MNKIYIQNQRLNGFQGVRLTVAVLLTALMITGNASAGVKVKGNVYGGGNEANVGKSVTVNISSGEINGDVYGGGAKAHTNTDNWNENTSTYSQTYHQVKPASGTPLNGYFTDAAGANAASGTADGNTTYYKKTETKVNITGGEVKQDVYGGGLGDKASLVTQADPNHEDKAAMVYGDVTVTVNGTDAKARDVFGANNVNGSPKGVIAVNINNTISDGIRNVYGGGNQATYEGTGTTVTMTAGKAENVYGGGNLADVSGSVTVNIQGGTVTTDVYGGGALANTNIGNATNYGLDNETINLATYSTLVNLTDGLIGRDVYGGGLGRKAVEAKPDDPSTPDVDESAEAVIAVSALVYGNVTVNIGATDESANYTGNVTIGGRVFGCNNANGTPKGDVHVNVYKTAHTSTETNNQYPSSIEGLELDDDREVLYALEAVYGGGNEAAYLPIAGTGSTPHSTTVHIFGCTENTVKAVYGGGNAADVGTTGNSGITADTHVIIEGGRFYTVFGGGNGAGANNPGANIYGTASTDIQGGLFNQIFGGSDSKGDVNVVKLSLDNLCETLMVRESFGGANMSPLTGNVITTLACSDNSNRIIIGNFYGGSNQAVINGDVTLYIFGGTYTNVFGGSKGVADDPDTQDDESISADIKGDVTLNLYGGTMINAFGGSDVCGNIEGKITVNVLDYQSATCPLNITNIYGAGNLTAYTPNQVSNQVISSPEVNVIHMKSGNSITGNVYGGGKGDPAHNALVTANPVVNIGYDATTMSTLIPNGYLTALEFESTDNLIATVTGNVLGGGDLAGVTGSTTVNLRKANSSVGAIYGGGNLADVSGSTTVNINNGTVTGDVYGGGALANVGTSGESPTTHQVTISNGTINGDVYGGGLGRIYKAPVQDDPNTTDVNEAEPEEIAIAANVNGSVTVTMAGGSARNIFGCNNQNGSPKGTVVVTINGTKAHTPASGDSPAVFAVQGVYGGGNLAHYDPTTPGNYPTVTINGCESSIKDVYGGGNAAAVPYTNVTINSGIIDRVFAGGNGESGTPAHVGWKNADASPSSNSYGAGTATALIHGGTIRQVFGGSNANGTIHGATSVEVNKSGDCAMKIGEVYGGGNLAAGNAGTITIGCTGTWTTTGDKNHTNANTTDNRIGYELEGIGTVYGGANQANIGTAESPSNITLNINSGMVANVFGGNNTSGTIHGDIVVNIEKNAETCSWYVGNVYGGGNLAPYSQKTASHPVVNIKNGTISGSVYGGGKGSTAIVTGNPIVTIGDATAAHCAVVSGNVYGGGDAAAVTGNTTVTYNDNNASSTVTNLFGGGNAAGISGNTTVTLTSGKVQTAMFGGCNTSGTVGGTSTVTVTDGTVGTAFTTTAPTAPSPIPNVLFGGGKGAATSVTGQITLNVGTKEGSTYSGTANIHGNVYGGSEEGEVHAVDVNLYGNTIYGNVFGGGYQTASDKTAATAVNVVLDGTKFNRSFDGTAQIFGCNNLVGTPLGQVNVHVFRTVAASNSDTYHVAAVYGGGNEADYVPTASSVGSTQVIIEGCNQTSIKDVYGGGNAAAVPGTEIWILGSTIIDRVFGGGNGELGEASAAHVGFHRDSETTKHDYTNGTGKTEIFLVAGTINDVYGGSNSHGDIRRGADVKTATQADYTTKFTNAPTPNCCTKLVTQHIYGGGSQAEMSGDVNVILECMPDDYVDAVYGGAANATINGNVTLTVTSGKFGRVFGGNNQGGSINGSITVNIYEDGCQPLKIGELYGGGNLAPYSVYGCEFVDTNNDGVADTWRAKESGTSNVTSRDDAIQVNVFSCTSIGKVYGGGLGSTAKVIGNTHVWVNMLNGIINGTPKTNQDDNYIGKIGQVFGGGSAADVKGNTTIDIGTATVHPNKENKELIGVNIIPGDDYLNPTSNANVSITDAGVYGGGEAADVIGNTTLNIGKENLSEGTNITGNIFGGGLGETTHVTGNVRVNIGKEVPAVGEGSPTYVGYANITGDVYGGSAKGKVNSYLNDSDEETLTTGATTQVNFYGGTISGTGKGNIYGGGLGESTHAADVYGPVTVNVYGGTANNVFGCNNVLGSPKQTATVNIYGTVAPETPATYTITSVYGGGNLAAYNGTGGLTVNMSGGYVNDVFGGGLGSSATVNESAAVNVTGGTITNNIYGGGSEANMTGNATVSMSAGSAKTVFGGGNLANVTGNTTLNITGGTLSGTEYGSVKAAVFGGGFGESTKVGGTVIVNIGAKSDAVPPVYSGTASITGDVYGGSAKGKVNTTDGSARTTGAITDVNLYGGTITGSLYGGGLGDLASLGEGHGDVEANVYGPVTVTVQKGKASNVFGCNNLNGSPQNTVAVYIKGTDPVSIGTSAIGNVYGGGNQAEYTYADAANPLLVEITGGTTYQDCTIGNVYGGGLSANVRGSITVNIKGGKILGDVYGGGALAHTNTANWNPNGLEDSDDHELGEWKYEKVDGLREPAYEDLGVLDSGKDVKGLYIKNESGKYVLTSDKTADGIKRYYKMTDSGSIIGGYYTKSGDVYTLITDPTPDADGNYDVPKVESGIDYYKKRVVGNWATDMNNSSTGTTYKTIVNLTGGIVGNVYGGALGDLAALGTGHSDVSAIVYGDVEVTLGNPTNTTPDIATAFVQEFERPEGSDIDIPISGRLFGCNNINGTPLGNVTVTVNKTRQVMDEVTTADGHSDNKYDVHSVYGGGNLSRYEPASEKQTKVFIDGCEKTSIEKVFGGGNSAAVPQTTVVILGTHHIGYVFGGGNGADKIKKGSTWENNNGAPVYGDVTVLAIGGKIGMTFAGSDTKGAIWGTATTKLKPKDGTSVDGYTSSCPLKITHSYGAGRGAAIYEDVNYVVSGCTDDQIETVFGGSYDANIRGNVTLTITSGIFTQVFGGNDHGGSIGGTITVNIEESDDCNPTIIQYLYGGGREAAYPGINAQNKSNVPVTRGNIIVNIKSATRIDNVSGGGWRSLVNGDTEVNINMIKGSWVNKQFELPAGYRGNPIPNSDMVADHYEELSVAAGEPISGLYNREGESGNYVYTQITEQLQTAPADGTYYRLVTGAIRIADEIGTIGNVYGGSYQSETHGNATVNIGTKHEINILKRAKNVPGVADGTLVNKENLPVYDSEGKIIENRTVAEVTATVIGAHITGNVYGGGDLASMERYEEGKDEQNKPIYTANTGNTFVNICAVKDDDDATQYNAVSFANLSEGKPAIKIDGSVYGGGRGLADDFYCALGMVNGDAGTTVRIGNGTVDGSVYGGGEVGRVETNSNVMIGLNTGVTSTPVINGNVFGGGMGVSTHGYSALLRGDTHVTVQANTKVRKSVYGGGEIASVGRYNVATEENAAQYGVEPGMPYSLATALTGQCFVTIQGNAEIGPNEAMTMPTFLGNVFGGGKGVLPYEGYAANENPWRMPPTNNRQYYTSDQKTAYLKYVETLALATRTFVTIDGSAFVKGSVYGGSEEGIVQQNTLVKIKGGQIGCGKNSKDANNKPIPHPTSVWDIVTPSDDNADYECASWPYQNPYKPYDIYANDYDSKGGATTGKDGHTYYGNVFGGGCGKDPYRAGEWHNRAGAVGGNTEVRISGGHILTNVYGGNELTNVGTDGVDTTGVCTIIMSGGTLGVPRTLNQIKNHPVTCYLFGAGKGDQRVLFNKETNVRDVVVRVTGGTIYGSVFGGGEDGHVMRDVQMSIGNTDGTGPKIGTWGTSYVDGNVFGGGRGFAGDSYTAGNVAGSIKLDIKGGTMLGSIYGGGRLASVGYGLFESTNTTNYGVMQDDDKNDKGESTDFYNVAKQTNRILTTADNVYEYNHNLGLGRGHIVINISGGTIGNMYEYTYVPTNISDLTTWKDNNHVPNTEYNTTTTTEGNTTTYTHRLKHTKGGNVFAGSMGRRTKIDGTPIPTPTQTGDIDWQKLGNAKSTKLTISGTPWIMGNVYGGCEFGAVTGNHNLLDGSTPITDTNGDNMVAGTEIIVTGGTIGTEITETTPVKTTASNGTVKYTFGSIYGGGMGMDTDGGGEVMDSTNVKVSEASGSTTLVRASVFGGGEMGDVDGNTLVTISGGKIGRNEVYPANSNDPKEGYVMFGGATMGNVYGGGFGNEAETDGAIVKKNTRVFVTGGEIYHNVYGGGALASVGTFNISDGTGDQAHIPAGIPYGWTSGTGTATVVITGGTIGISGRDNGMVNGSSRGEVAKPTGTPARDPYDKLAWVNETFVKIGTSGSNSEYPKIRGSVYGGGENGHNAGDAVVKMYSGKVGAFTGDTWATFTNATAIEKATITRGNVYGAGCGTDTYTGDDGNEHNNPWAGLVAGNTYVAVHGGEVTNNVYGGGSMGSVGTIISDLDGTSMQHRSADNADLKQATTLYDFGLSWPLEITYAATNTGTANVTIDGTAQIDNYVFGGARGKVEFGVSDITEHRYEEAKFANVRETQVIIGGTATVRTVYGGGEDGHVYENASVTINSGTIERTVFGGGKGTSTFKSTLWDPNKEGYNKKDSDNKDIIEDVHSWTAGKVYGNTTVTINGGSIGWFVYGGGNMASVGKGNYAGGADDYSTAGYGELPSASGNLWTTTSSAESATKDMPWHFLNSGTTTVNILGGTIGTDPNDENDHTKGFHSEYLIPYGSVFGGSRGVAAASCKKSPRYRYVPDFFLGYVNNARINIGKTRSDFTGESAEADFAAYEGPTIYGSIYGGGQDGHVRNSTEVHVYKGSIAGQTIDDAGRSGHVFGAGSGIGTYKDGSDDNKEKVNNSSGSVTCYTLIEVNGGTIAGNVYGGGALASVGPPKTPAQTDDEQKATSGTHKSYSYTKVDIKGGQINGSVFGASRGPGDSYLTTAPVPVFDTEATETLPKGHYDPSKYSTDIWSFVNVTGGTISGSVYGGGEGGRVKQDTEVSLTGGTITNDAFGGGKGTMNVPANVLGNTTVELNKGKAGNEKGCVVNRIFGCNDFRGTPKGHVMVHVYATQKAGGSNISDKFALRMQGSNETPKAYLTRLINIAKPSGSAYLEGVDAATITEAETIRDKANPTDAELETAISNVNAAINASKDVYDVEAVYGGGNLAPYEPTDAMNITGYDPNVVNEVSTRVEAATTQVIIDGCHLTSIRQVYGGGNAASTPATSVEVNGTYEIYEVFGGGNGADNYQHPINGKWYQNPGANVGYKDFTETGSGSGDSENDPILHNDKENARGSGDEAASRRRTYYAYGSGIATTMVKGGKVHIVYGGSNERGNIRTRLLSQIESMIDDCPLDVDQSYGGSNTATYDGVIDTRLQCAKGVKEMFGGSKNSDVNSDINLTITNGSSLERVFGGNNTSGAINGTITVNIEENGCEPIHIGELYLGGYLAPYSIYGYVQDGHGGYVTEDITYEGIGTISQRIPLTKEQYEVKVAEYRGYMQNDLKEMFGNTNYEPTDAEIAAKAADSQFARYAAEYTSIKELLAAYPKKDPRINVISASRIDNIFGGGYQAKVVGNPHINVNMTNGKVDKSFVDEHVADFTSEHTDPITGVLLYKGEEVLIDGSGKLAIGTIGNIFGGGNLADIDGNTYVEIGTGEWLNKNDEREMLGTTLTIDTPTKFTYKKISESEWKWTYENPTTVDEPITGTITPDGEGVVSATPSEGDKVIGTCATDGITTSTTFTYKNGKWTYEKPSIETVAIDGKPNPFRNEATIDGHVYGGGQGIADHFVCDKAMINGDDGTSVIIANGTIKHTVDKSGNVIGGNVYGGGKIGRVENNTSVTIGLDGVTDNASFMPVIEGSVFGAGKGVNTHGYSALVRGSSTVVVQGKSKVKGSVYGGGEMASVGKYKVVDGLPQALFDDNSNTSGYCYVTIKDDAEIGPDDMQMFHNGVAAADDAPDDAGHVFGAGKGVLPYEGYEDNVQPYHMNGTQVLDDQGNWDGKSWADEERHYPAYNDDANKNNKNPNPAYYNEAGYFTFIKSLALATETHVVVKDNAFVKGSVYGGSENGFVQHNTHVLIDGKCQIGNGFVQMDENGNYLDPANRYSLNRRYTDAEWAAGHLIKDGESNYAHSLPECASWVYGIDIDSDGKKDVFAPHDKFASTVTDHEEKYSDGSTTNGGRRIASDGHTFYGSVFGGGSGYYPYRPGKWFESAGSVLRNTYLTIKGGHILTCAYGGNEMTDVGKYGKDEDGNLIFIPDPTGKDYGTCYVTMTGGTLGVPRTLKQIAAHPVTCYLFGAGKGDQRVFFNESTDVGNAVVHVSDNARIYGSVFGGGEDGHVMQNVTLSIGSKFPTLPTGDPSSYTNEENSLVNIASAYTDDEWAALNGTKEVTVGEGDDVVTTYYPLIGTTGTSYVDGNVFGAGRGFSGDALTAGSIGGNVEMNIKGGTMLGSIYGGGRLASVGIPFTYVNNSNYGSFTDDPVVTPATYYTAADVIPEGKKVGDEKTAAVVNKLHGHVTVNISGGTIGNDLENQFFTSSVDITGMTEEQIAAARATELEGFKTANKIPYTEFEYDAETNKYIPTHTKGGNVFGGSMGRLELLDGSVNTKLWPQLGQVKTATVNISGDNTLIKDCVYGGGELGTVRDSTTIVIGKEGKDATSLSRPTIIRDVYGGGFGSKINNDSYVGFVESEYKGDDNNPIPMVFMYTPMKWAGLVGIKTNVNIYDGWVKRNVYGGGELASVGVIDYRLKSINSHDENDYDVVKKDKDGNIVETYHFAKEYANIVEHGNVDNSFALSWPYKVEYFSGYPGDTYINIRGGRLGVSDDDNTWKDNGDIYGGSKGKAGDRYKMASCGNVGSTNILIDYPSTNGADFTNFQTETSVGSGVYPRVNDCIVGAVYGGGEDGHVMGDTHVTLKNGLIGHALYGGGSGKGKYNAKRLKIGATKNEQGKYDDDDYHYVDIYSITSGKVYGNTHVKMEGGYVGRFVYGGGNMGSVGKGNYACGPDDYYPGGYGEKIVGDDVKLWETTATAADPDNAWHFLNTGKTNVEIFDGTIGYVNTTKPSKTMKDGLPYGSVFGGSRGESAPNISESPRYLYCPEFFSGYVNQTEVTIGGYKCIEACTGKDSKEYAVGATLTAEQFKAAISDDNASKWTLVGPKIRGSVFGGGQDGHVRRDTHVIVDAGEIGLSLSGHDLSSSQTNEQVLGDFATDGVDNPQWLHRGNVYGAGSGIGKYIFDFDNDGKAFDDYDEDGKYDEDEEEIHTATYNGKEVKEVDFSTSAGSVTCNTIVDINGGIIHRNVYGGGSLASVGHPKIPLDRTDTSLKETDDTHGPGWLSLCTVNIRGTIGTPDDYQAHYGGEVYGASRGLTELGESFANTVWTLVRVLNGANIQGNVFGGGDNGIVKRDTDVRIGDGE